MVINAVGLLFLFTGWGICGHKKIYEMIYLRLMNVLVNSTILGVCLWAFNEQITDVYLHIWYSVKIKRLENNLRINIISMFLNSNEINRIESSLMSTKIYLNHFINTNNINKYNCLLTFTYCEKNNNNNNNTDFTFTSPICTINWNKQHKSMNCASLNLYFTTWNRKQLSEIYYIYRQHHRVSRPLNFPFIISKNKIVTQMPPSSLFSRTKYKLIDISWLFLVFFIHLELYLFLRWVDLVSFSFCILHFCCSAQITMVD